MRPTTPDGPDPALQPGEPTAAASDPEPHDVVGEIRTVVGLARDPRSTSTPADALLRVDPSALDVFLHAKLDDAGLVPLTAGLPASPGAASGRIALTAAAAVDASARGEPVILVRRETTPEDVVGMQSSRGILTAQGGFVSHAAVVARGWGIPAVVGADELRVGPESIGVRDHVLHAGDEITIDGASGLVYRGAGSVATVEAPAELDVLLEWADAFRRAGHVEVRANADTARDVRHAIRLGADGVGLCRTEHMFLAADRLPLVRRLIMSDDPEEEAAALAALEAAQEHDLRDLLRAVGDRPVTVRLLDPPLHEFLPDIEPLLVQEATGRLDDLGRSELAAARRLHEANPMIGTRGVRLGVAKPGLYPTQVRALIRAAATVAEEGISPRVEIMVPLVVDPAEMRQARRWVRDALRGLDLPSGVVVLGTMVETPRAALLGGELAAEADFFSFGTNDLTQLTFAFSRDDVETRLLPRYLAAGLLAANPFEQLDEAGVGRLVRLAVREARAVKPDLEVGVCGEHAGDPRSARFLVACGVNHVSCSPYRVPIARVAIARALLELELVDGTVVGAPECEQAAHAWPETHGDATRTGHLPPAGGSSGARDATAEVERLVLHALRVKGFADAALIADIVDLRREPVEQVLHRLVAEGAVRFLEARGLWQLLAAGRDRHAALGPGATHDELAIVRSGYEAFLAQNVRFKELCNRWQLRDGQPNDHTDQGYDQGCIATLRALHADTEPVLDHMAQGVQRLGRYHPRLRAAIAGVASGDHRKFTGVLCGSYHDVWMELHEDLVLLLAVDRAAEGSF